MARVGALETLWRKRYNHSSTIDSEDSSFRPDLDRFSKDTSEDTYYSECKMIEHVLFQLYELQCFTGKLKQRIEYDNFNLEKNEFSPQNSNHLFYLISFGSSSDTTMISPFYCTSLVAKISRNYLYFLPSSYKNERLFYEMIATYCGKRYLTRCYMHKKIPYDPPVLILGRLKKYRSLQITLDEDHLKLCMKILAYFHADMMRLKNDKCMFFEWFCNKLYSVNDSRRELKMSIREVMEKLNTRDLGNNLLKKVKNKCNKYLVNGYVNNMMTDKFSTLIHGHFVRSKVMFRYKDSELYNMKIIGWGSVSYGSPSFDLGSILLTNMPAVTNAAELETFYREMLCVYLNNFMYRYAHVPIYRDKLEQSIIERLLFSYIKHHFAISDHVNYHRLNMHKMVLEMFDKLGCLN